MLCKIAHFTRTISPGSSRSSPTLFAPRCQNAWVRTLCSTSPKKDVVDAIKHLTRGRGVDVAIEALGNQGETSARGHPDFLAQQEHLEIGLGNKMFLHILTSSRLGQLALMYD